MPDPGMKADLTTLFERRMGELSDQLANGSITLGDWQIGMRQELRQAFALELIAGAGGNKAEVDPNDWLRLGSALKSQYAYLEDFAHAVRDGDIEGDAIASRAALYARSAQTAYWKQYTKGVDLPTMPGEQACLGNCGCEWVDNGDGSWTWKRGKSDSCHDCVHNEEEYNPYWPVDAAEAEDIEDAA